MLHFYIDENDLLDHNKGVFKVNIKYFLHHEQVVDTITRDVDVKKGDALSLTHMLAKLWKNNK